MSRHSSTDQGAARLLSELRERAPRVTRQRRLIVETIAHGGGHLTAEKIISAVEEKLPGTSRSTVYRNLQALEEMGLITHVHMGHGVAEYQSVDHGEHVHIVCGSCGTSAEIDQAMTDDLQRTLDATHGFLAEFEHFSIYGTCAACRAERARFR